MEECPGQKEPQTEGWGKGTLPFRHGAGDTVSGGEKVAD